MLSKYGNRAKSLFSSISKINHHLAAKQNHHPKRPHWHCNKRSLVIPRGIPRVYHCGCIVHPAHTIDCASALLFHHRSFPYGYCRGVLVIRHNNTYLSFWKSIDHAATSWIINRTMKTQRQQINVRTRGGLRASYMYCIYTHVRVRVYISAKSTLPVEV